MRNRNYTWVYLLCFAACVALISFQVYVILKDAGWTIGDDSLLLTTTVLGKMKELYINPEAGRFSPLGLYEYNLLIPFGNKPLAYFLVAAFKFLLATFILSATLRMVNRKGFWIFLLLFLLLPFLWLVYPNLIYCETTLVILVAAFCYCYLKIEQQNKFWSYSCLMLAAAATYVKEPMFIAFAMLGLSGFLFRSKERIWLHAALIVNGLIYLVLYFSFVGFRESTYLAQIRLPFDQWISWTWQDDKTVFAMIFVFAIRVASCLAGDRQFRIYDSFLFAGMSYVSALAVLGIESGYYTLPAHVFFLVALCGYGNAWSQKTVPKEIFIIIFVLALWQAYSIPAIVSDISMKRREHARLVELLNEYDNRNYSLFYFGSTDTKIQFLNEWRLFSLDAVLNAKYGKSRIVTMTMQPSAGYVLTGPESNTLNSVNLVRSFAEYNLYRIGPGNK